MIQRSWLLPNRSLHTPPLSANRSDAESMWLRPSEKKGSSVGGWKYQRPVRFSTVKAVLTVQPAAPSEAAARKLRRVMVGD